MRAYFVGLSVIVISLFGGCSTKLELHYTPTKVSSAQPPEAVEPALKPQGHGIAVCDPVMLGTVAQRDFAMGCGRWLEMTLAGDPAMGQSPSWGETIEAARNCKHIDLALLPKDMPVFLRATGSDLGILGSFTGSGSKWTLTYRVYSIRTHGLIGKACSVSGSQADIINGLPRLAQSILLAVGVAQAKLTAPVNIGPGQLTQIGALTDYGPGSQISDSLQATVLSMASTVPLAALTCLTYGVSPHDDVKALMMQTAAIAAAPENTLVLETCSISKVLPGTLLPAIDSVLAKYPSCYLARDARFQVIRQYAESTNRTPPELNPAEIQRYRAAATALTQCAPENPSGYAKVRSAVSEIGGEMRNYRAVGMINNTEMNKLLGMYKECVAADRHALKLNPLRTHSWDNLAVDSTFLGDQATASSAVETALRQDNSYQPAYFWLLQMNMPKWFDSPRGLARARARVRAAHFSDFDMIKAGGDLDDAEDHVGATHLFAVAKGHIQANLAKNPNDFGALYLLTKLAHIQNDDEAAIPILRRMTKIYPNVGDIRVDLGNYLYGAARNPERRAQYAEARRLDLGTSNVLNTVMGE